MVATRREMELWCPNPDGASFVTEDCYNNGVNAFMSLIDRKLSLDHLCPICKDHPEVLLGDVTSLPNSNGRSGIDAFPDLKSVAAPADPTEITPICKHKLSLRCTDDCLQACSRDPFHKDPVIPTKPSNKPPAAKKKPFLDTSLKICKGSKPMRLLARWTQHKKNLDICKDTSVKGGAPRTVLNMSEYRTMLKTLPPCLKEVVEYVVLHWGGDKDAARR